MTLGGLSHSNSAGSSSDDKARKDFLKKYDQIIRILGIDVAQNIQDARNMNTVEWLNNVRSGGDWDYKNDDLLKQAGIPDALRDEFGNVHFGMVANAHGFDLETSLYGAGLYQVFFQDGGNPEHLATATAILSAFGGGEGVPDWITRLITNSGFTWGDNPGDSINIMNGWDHAYEYY